MRGLIYDFVTGMAIIIGLFVITYVMRANQNFIMESANDETNDEQVLYEEIDSREETYYRISDVYGTFHTLLKNGNNTPDQTRWSVYDYTSIYVQGIGWVADDANIDNPSYKSTTTIGAIETYLKTILADQPNAKFKVERKAYYNATKEHRYMVYMFTKS